MEWSDSKFIGAYNLKLLTNSKIKIPDEFLNIYKRRKCKIIEIIPSIDRSLILLPIEEWEKILKYIEERKRGKKYKDIFLKYPFHLLSLKSIKKSRNSEIKNGQIFIDNSLQSYTKIKRNIIMIGMLNYVEIWAKEVWEKHLKNRNIKEMMDEIDLLK